MTDETVMKHYLLIRNKYGYVMTDETVIKYYLLFRYRFVNHANKRQTHEDCFIV